MSRRYTPFGSQNTVSTGAASTDTCSLLCRENPVSTASSCYLTAIIRPNDTVSSTPHDKPPASPLRTPLSLAPHNPVSSKLPKNTAILTLFRPYMCGSPPTYHILPRTISVPKTSTQIIAIEANKFSLLPGPFPPNIPSVLQNEPLMPSKHFDTKLAAYSYTWQSTNQTH